LLILENDRKFRCYICNIDKTEFSKKGKNFNEHNQSEHNPWDYIYFLVYLHEKNKEDFNGTESYIFEKYKKQDISWFPIEQALCLNSEENTKEEDLEERFEQLILVTRRKWKNLFDAKREELAKL